MAYFHCLIGGGSSGGGYELTVTCDADFAGTTITCTDGVTTLTQTCPSASPYEVVFEIPNGGEWTISGIISGQTYSASIDIPDSLELHSTPEGSTVLPTDDIQIWLACAGITDKSYTTLNEVLADSTTLLALISDNNAVDYLVRSTTWASGITADSTAMTDIGANDYCAETLLADSTWLTAICNSTYFESVLNVKVPTMTSNTAPSGEASASKTYASGTTYYPYLAFDKDTADGKCWVANAAANQWLQYEFTNPVCINRIDLINRYATSSNQQQGVNTFDILASNDGFVSDSHTLYSGTASLATSLLTQKFSFSNTEEYKYYRLFVKTNHGNSGYIGVVELQFYGRYIST